MTEENLIADYADLGVSCGYIGGVHWGPSRDDRSFRVFTEVYVPRKGAMYVGQFERVALRVFDVPHDHKGVWLEEVDFDTPAIRGGLDTLREEVAAGRAHVCLTA